MDEEDYQLITVTGALADEGTIIVLSGIAEDGHSVSFGADRRMALAILDALDDDEPPVAAVAPWQMLGVH